MRTRAAQGEVDKRATAIQYDAFREPYLVREGRAKTIPSPRSWELAACRP
jgi:hypothetical protein